jgi:hypothetical protein
LWIFLPLHLLCGEGTGAKQEALLSFSVTVLWISETGRGRRRLQIKRGFQNMV